MVELFDMGQVWKSGASPRRITTSKTNNDVRSVVSGTRSPEAQESRGSGLAIPRLGGERQDLEPMVPAGPGACLLGGV